MGLTILYTKKFPCKNFTYKYTMLDYHTIEITYFNRNSHVSRTYIVRVEYPLSRELVDEATVIAENLYTIVKDKAAKPNIPLYALIIALLRRYRGLSYKCKIARVSCPIEIHRIYDGVNIKMSTASIFEQVYRVMKKYSSL